MAKETDAFSHMLYTSVYCSAPTPIRMLVYSRKVYPKTQRLTDNSAKTLQNLTLTLGIINSKYELCNSLQQ